MGDASLKHCVEVWSSAKEWKTGVVVPLFKKRGPDYANYRGITLLCLHGKVYCEVLERRVQLKVEPQLGEEQCGFCLCVEQLTSFLLSQRSCQRFYDVNKTFASFGGFWFFWQWLAFEFMAFHICTWRRSPGMKITKLLQKLKIIAARLIAPLLTIVEHSEVYINHRWWIGLLEPIFCCISDILFCLTNCLPIKNFTQ